MSVSIIQSYSFTPKTKGILYETIPDRIKYFAERTPDKVACVFLYPNEGRRHSTYKEIYTKCICFAKGLKYLNITRGDIVAVGILNDPEWIIATFASQMIGAMPLHFMFQRTDGSDILRILKVVGKCSVVVCDPGHNNSNIEILKNFICFESDGVVSCSAIPSLKYLISTKTYGNPAEKTNLTVEDVMCFGESNTMEEIDLSLLSPEDTAGIFLSSGSTGTPKAIPHTHYSLLIMGFHFDTAFRMTNSDVYYNDRTFNWIGGYPCIMLYRGHTRVTVHSLGSFKSIREINQFIANAVDSECVTSSLLITPCMHDMITGGIPDCKGLPLKMVGTGGMPVSSSITACVGTLCDTLVVLYGLTEIGMASAKYVQSGDTYDNYNVGTPLPGVEIKVVDEKEQVVQPGETGELYIRHPVNFLGYINETEKTKAVYSPCGWYKTDDVGHMTKGMDFFACGRKSDTVIIAGQIISVSYMESTIKQHPVIYDALVTPITSESTYQQICAAVVLKPNCELTAEQVKDYLSNQYTTKETVIFRTGIVPRYVLFFDSFPKTFNGKVFRRGVTDMVSERLSKE